VSRLAIRLRSWHQDLPEFHEWFGRSFLNVRLSPTSHAHGIRLELSSMHNINEDAAFNLNIHPHQNGRHTCLNRNTFAVFHIKSQSVHIIEECQRVPISFTTCIVAQDPQPKCHKRSHSRRGGLHCCFHQILTHSNKVAEYIFSPIQMFIRWVQGELSHLCNSEGDVGSSS